MEVRVLHPPLRKSGEPRCATRPERTAGPAPWVRVVRAAGTSAACGIADRPAQVGAGPTPNPRHRTDPIVLSSGRGTRHGTRHGSSKDKDGSLAQPGRATGCRPEGRGFDSRTNRSGREDGGRDDERTDERTEERRHGNTGARAGRRPAQPGRGAVARLTPAPGRSARAGAGPPAVAGRVGAVCVDRAAPADPAAAAAAMAGRTVKRRDHDPPAAGGTARRVTRAFGVGGTHGGLKSRRGRFDSCEAHEMSRSGRDRSRHAAGGPRRRVGRTLCRSSSAGRAPPS